MTGIPQRSLENWEEGIAFPREENIRLLCKLYGKGAKQLGLDRSSAIMGIENNAPTIQEGIVMSDLIRRAFFGDLGSKLNGLVLRWPHRNYHYEELQTEIDKAVLAYNAAVEYDAAYAATRRNALKSLGLTAIQLCGGATITASSKTRNKMVDMDTVLAYCAAGIAAAWYLRHARHRVNSGRGKDLLFAYDLASTYVTILEPIMAKQSEVYRKAAASLLAQSFMLKGSLAQCLENSDQAIPFGAQAIEYSDLAGNLRLEAFANRMMAQFQYGAKKYEQALTFSERAAALIKLGNLDKLTQSWIYSGLTYCQAFNGQVDHSVTSLTLARDLFDPHALLPACMQYNQGVLDNCGGVASLRNGNYQEAADFFDEHMTLGSLIEAKLGRANVEVLRDDKERDRDLAVSLWTQGITEARELGSKHFIDRAYESYNLLRAAWPTEDAVKKLREYF
jgi:hypothetical protein